MNRNPLKKGHEIGRLGAMPYCTLCRVLCVGILCRVLCVGILAFWP